MLTYNTHLKPLVLPEYGRNIQNMVELCKTIEDREERNKCARSIIVAMRTLLPQSGDQTDIQQKLWDHLAIMSKFELDIDYPFDVVQAEELHSDPQPLPTAPNYIPNRMYGLHVVRLVDIASSMEPGEERDNLVMLLANQMKKLRMSVNAEGVDDQRIFDDLAEMSHGVLKVDPQQMKLHDFEIQEIASPAKKKRKRKK